MSDFAHLKHPVKALLDQAESRCLSMLMRLDVAGIKTASTSNDPENLFLHIMDAPEDAVFGLEVHYEATESRSAVMAELVFLDEEEGEDRASLFRLCWWSDRGMLVELDTIGDSVAVSEQALAFACDFGLTDKGQSRPIEDSAWPKVMDAMIEQFKAGF